MNIHVLSEVLFQRESLSAQVAREGLHTRVSVNVSPKRKLGAVLLTAARVLTYVIGLAFHDNYYYNYLHLIEVNPRKTESSKNSNRSNTSDYL